MEFIQESSYCGGDHFIVEDLLDFSNDDAVFTDGTFDSSLVLAHSTDSSTFTPVDSCNSSLFSVCEPNTGTVSVAEVSTTISLPVTFLYRTTI